MENSKKTQSSPKQENLAATTKSGSPNQSKAASGSPSPSSQGKVAEKAASSEKPSRSSGDRNSKEEKTENLPLGSGPEKQGVDPSHALPTISKASSNNRGDSCGGPPSKDRDKASVDHQEDVSPSPVLDENGALARPIISVDITKIKPSNDQPKVTASRNKSVPYSNEDQEVDDVPAEVMASVVTEAVVIEAAATLSGMDGPIIAGSVPSRDSGKVDAHVKEELQRLSRESRGQEQSGDHPSRGGQELNVATKQSSFMNGELDHSPESVQPSQAPDRSGHESHENRAVENVKRSDDRHKSIGEAENQNVSVPSEELALSSSTKKVAVTEENAFATSSNDQSKSELNNVNIDEPNGAETRIQSANSRSTSKIPSDREHQTDTVRGGEVLPEKSKECEPKRDSGLNLKSNSGLKCATETCEVAVGQDRPRTVRVASTSDEAEEVDGQQATREVDLTEDQGMPTQSNIDDTPVGESADIRPISSQSDGLSSKDSDANVSSEDIKPSSATSRSSATSETEDVSKTVSPASDAEDVPKTASASSRKSIPDAVHYEPPPRRKSSTVSSDQQIADSGKSGDAENQEEVEKADTVMEKPTKSEDIDAEHKVAEVVGPHETADTSAAETTSNEDIETGIKYEPLIEENNPESRSGSKQEPDTSSEELKLELKETPDAEKDPEENSETLHEEGESLENEDVVIGDAPTEQSSEEPISVDADLSTKDSKVLENREEGSEKTPEESELGGQEEQQTEKDSEILTKETTSSAVDENEPSKDSEHLTKDTTTSGSTIEENEPAKNDSELLTQDATTEESEPAQKEIESSQETELAEATKTEEVEEGPEGSCTAEPSEADAEMKTSEENLKERSDQDVPEAKEPAADSENLADAEEEKKEEVEEEPVETETTETKAQEVEDQQIEDALKIEEDSEAQEQTTKEDIESEAAPPEQTETSQSEVIVEESNKVVADESNEVAAEESNKTEVEESNKIEGGESNETKDATAERNEEDLIGEDEKEDEEKKTEEKVEKSADDVKPKSPVKRVRSPEKGEGKGVSPITSPPKPRKTPTSPKKPQKSVSPRKKNGLLSPIKTPKTPGSDGRKLPPIKAPVGLAPNPNLKNIKSKIGSFDNIKYKPGGGDKKVVTVKLDWKAAPKVGSLEKRAKFGTRATDEEAKGSSSHCNEDQLQQSPTHSGDEAEETPAPSFPEPAAEQLDGPLEVATET